MSSQLIDISAFISQNDLMHSFKKFFDTLGDNQTAIKSIRLQIFILFRFFALERLFGASIFSKAQLNTAVLIILKYYFTEFVDEKYIVH